MGESETGNAYGIKILRCPMCGEILTKREKPSPYEFTEKELQDSPKEPDLIIELPHGNRYKAKIAHVEGAVENCEVTIRLNMLEDRV